jgi:predicted alpha/beta superfamily hydrolase
MKVTVTYPLRAGRLHLRTALDWDHDLEPVAATATSAVFEVPVVGPSLALKPVIRDGDAVHWAQGPDYVLSAGEPDPDLYPYFFSAQRGRVSNVLRVQSEDGVHAVRIYHPPGYDENTLRRYPVLYMQDGNNLFFPEESFAGDEWKVDETMDRLDGMNAIRKAIVVGVSPSDRTREYTAPGYHAYGRFLVERLKPLLDAHLRTLPGPANAVVMGSSLGGVVALFLAWEYPHIFGRVACLSSTFGYQDDLFQRIATEPRRPLHIYLDSGWPRDNYDATNAMRDLLMYRGWRLGVDLMQFSFPEGLHDEESWAMRSHLPFQYFFGRAWRVSRGED